MKYNFDEIIDRKNTDSIKYDFAIKRGMPEDILPLWVADMDFRTPDVIIDVLKAKSDHGIFGYSESGQAYYDALFHWFKGQFDWEIKPQWLVKTPGVVYAITTAIRAYSKVGDGVLIQEPVYYPFKEAIKLNERKVVINQLVYQEGRYMMDFEDFEHQIIEHHVKMFILCNPHNPVGRVWKKEELIKLGDLCLKHGVLVVSDEIHADFIYPGFKHLVFAELKPEYLDITITCTAPSKTFNLAGLQISNVIIADNNLRKLFKDAIRISGYSQLGIMGIIACQAAYEKGQEWLMALKEYLYDNLAYIRDYLKTNLPSIRLVEPEGTYLVWLDCSIYQKEQELDDQQLNHLIIHKAKLWLDDGNMFGDGGSGFQRINIACPRSTLVEAMKRLAKGLNDAD